MRDQLDPQRSYLVQVLYLYIQALESSDIETVAHILHKAEEDSRLERMLLEINEVYQELDTPSLSSDELEYIQDFLLPFIERETSAGLNGHSTHREQKLSIPSEQLPMQESGQNLMKDTVNTATSASAEQQTVSDGNQRSVSRSTRKRRFAYFMQTLAAVLVVGLLLGSFLLLLSGRHPQTGGQPTGGVSKDATTVAVSSSSGTVYGLRARDGAILWHYATGIVDPSLGSDSSLSILSNVVYFAARGQVFALHSNDGTLLWHQGVLPTSEHVFGSTSYNFALDGNILLVRLANNGGDTGMLFALNASNGAILWRFNMYAQYIMVADHGIVYVGSSDANGDNQILRALRAVNGQELWRYTTGQRYITAPITAIVVDNVLYLQGDVYDEPVTNNTRIFQSLTALNATTGRMLWSKPLHTNPLSESQSNQGLLLSANNEIILYNGYNFCAYNSSNGSQLWCSHDFAHAHNTSTATPSSMPISRISTR